MACVIDVDEAIGLPYDLEALLNYKSPSNSQRVSVGPNTKALCPKFIPLEIEA